MARWQRQHPSALRIACARAGRGPLDLEALAGKIEQAGGRAVTAKADVSDGAAVSRLFDMADAAFGGPSVFFEGQAELGHRGVEIVGGGVLVVHSCHLLGVGRTSLADLGN